MCSLCALRAFVVLFHHPEARRRVLRGWAKTNTHAWSENPARANLFCSYLFVVLVATEARIPLPLAGSGFRCGLIPILSDKLVCELVGLCELLPFVLQKEVSVLNRILKRALLQVLGVRPLSSPRVVATAMVETNEGIPVTLVPSSMEHKSNRVTTHLVD